MELDSKKSMRLLEDHPIQVLKRLIKKDDYRKELENLLNKKEIITKVLDKSNTKQENRT